MSPKDTCNHILVISYLYPPLGGGGVQRVAKFVKYLPQFNWTPDIITVRSDRRYPIDTTLIGEIPQATLIHRVRTFSPLPFLFRLRNIPGMSFVLSVLHSVLTFICVIEPEVLWFVPAYRQAKKMLRSKKYAVIFSSSSPIVNHLVAWRLRRVYHIPWVADFRDEWTQNPFRTYPTPIHKKINQWLEKKLLRQADRILSVSEPLTQGFNSLVPDQPENKFATITNGFDEDDFDDSESADESTFCITYAGSMYGAQWPRIFFQALNHEMKNNNISPTDIHIKLIGRIPTALQKEIPPLVLNRCELVGYVNHRTSIQYIQRSSILLLYIATRRGIGTYTGKLFEYLASRRPILGIVPPHGVAAKLITVADAGIIVSPESRDLVSKAIREYYAQWKAQSLPRVGNSEIVRTYSRRAKTEELVHVLNSVVV